MKRLLMALLVLPACGGEDAGPRRVSLELAPIESFGSPQWSGTLAPSDPVVATVEGTPITASMLRHQLQRAEPGADPRKLLDRMIEFELMARAAFGSGRYTEAVVGEAMKKALARRLLEAELKDGVGLHSVPDEFVAKAFKDNIRRFDHYELFFLLDFQVLCCRETEPNDCYRDIIDDIPERRSHLQQCVTDHEQVARQMHEQLARATTIDALTARFEAATLTVVSPELLQTYGTLVGKQEYDFQYDVDRTYEQQFVTSKPRYRIFFQEVMDGVRDTWIAAGRKTPVLSKPIRSAIGWHIIYIKNVVPEKHPTVDDPEVQHEIREHYYEEWRKSRYAELVNGLLDAYDVEVFQQRLVPLQNLEKGN